MIKANEQLAAKRLELIQTGYVPTATSFEAGVARGSGIMTETWKAGYLQFCIYVVFGEGGVVKEMHTDRPAAACPACGGWTQSGGMSQFAEAVQPMLGRTGCACH